ncbi:MAG: extracellular solute-binding protein [Anaerolineaceae bacterium]|nr:extracellular solute-binding protein [Anaerolineaceae bacterium]
MASNWLQKISIGTAILLAALLTACSNSLFDFLLPEPTLTAPVTPFSPTPTSPQPTPTLPVDPHQIILWVPPQFDPQNSGEAGNLFKNQLAVFERENPKYRVVVRVKALTGPAGLMESMQSTAAAAPLAMPGLVALSRADLETATLRGLIVPIEGFTTIMEDSDWYSYAHNLAAVQNSMMGLPFAGDSLLIVYRPARLGVKPSSWEEILKTGQPVIFPADDPQAILTQALYQSKEGKLQDELGRPFLDEKTLSSVLIFYARGFQLGIFPGWFGQLQTYTQAWQAYQDQKGQIAVVWASQFLSTLPPDTTAAPLYPLGDKSSIPTNGWVWALSDPFPERRAVTIRLAEILSQSEFLANWTSAAGYLPTRPSALAAWKNQSLQSLANQVIPGAALPPSNDIQAILTPLLHEATLKVIRDQIDPIQTAQKAVEPLTPPKTP